ncbi:TetR/AcrR family transcriptional regulator [Nocardia brasiliensis]|uniref:TetR/AcrR family transcriptional regulator n=1 Tax=Nocardia brasiliensis TaxID=37326 RepID=UPI000B197FBC
MLNSAERQLNHSVSSPPTTRPIAKPALDLPEQSASTRILAFGSLAEHGPQAPLDDIARQAQVGPGTLYRHFPNRDALIEAVYRSSLEQLSRRAYLVTTLRAVMDHDSEVFTLCRATITDAAAALLRPARAAGTIRADVEPRDLLRFGHGIGAAYEKTPEAAPRMLAATLYGLRAAR